MHFCVWCRSIFANVDEIVQHYSESPLSDRRKSSSSSNAGNEPPPFIWWWFVGRFIIGFTGDLSLSSSSESEALPLSDSDESDDSPDEVNRPTSLLFCWWKQYFDYWYYNYNLFCGHRITIIDWTYLMVVWLYLNLRYRWWRCRMHMMTIGMMVLRLRLILLMRHNASMLMQHTSILDCRMIIVIII